MASRPHPASISAASIRAHPLTASSIALAALLFWAIAFPKGGVRIYGVPLTFGYIFTGGLLLLAFLRLRQLAIPLDRLVMILASVALTLWSYATVSVNGYTNPGYMLAYFVAVTYMPLFGLTVFSSLTMDQFWDIIEKVFLWAVRIITTYGIILFFYKQITGEWIQIPYLTINVDDVDTLDDKFINRGGIFKLISTYNNGNIFGVSLAIMAPLYLRLEKRRVLTWVMYASLFLTLSRTAWIAALIIMSLSALSRGLRPTAVIYLLIGAVAAASVITGLLAFLGFDLSFVFDTRLGGRVGQLDTLFDAGFTGQEPIDPLPEIIYLGVLRYFGIIGLVLFLGYLWLPPFLLWIEGTPLLSPSRASACLQGMVVYAIVAAADAAFSYIPVMMIFWMIAGLGFWYTHADMRLVRERLARAPAR